MDFFLSNGIELEEEGQSQDGTTGNGDTPDSLTSKEFDQLFGSVPMDQVAETAPPVDGDRKPYDLPDFDPQKATYNDAHELLPASFPRQMGTMFSDVTFWTNRLKKIEDAGGRGTEDYSKALLELQYSQRIADQKFRGMVEASEEFANSGLPLNEFLAKKRVEGYANSFDDRLLKLWMNNPLTGGVHAFAMRKSADVMASIEELIVQPIENMRSGRKRKAVLRDHYSKDLREMEEEFAVMDKEGILPPWAKKAGREGIAAWLDWQVMGGVSRARGWAVKVGGMQLNPTYAADLFYNSYADGKLTGEKAGLSDIQAASRGFVMGMTEIAFQGIGSKFGTLEEMSGLKGSLGKIFTNALVGEEIEENSTLAAQHFADYLYGLNDTMFPSFEDFRDTTLATAVTMLAESGSRKAQDALREPTKKHYEAIGLGTLNRRNRARVTEMARKGRGPLATVMHEAESSPTQVTARTPLLPNVKMGVEETSTNESVELPDIDEGQQAPEELEVGPYDTQETVVDSTQGFGSESFETEAPAFADPSQNEATVPAIDGPAARSQTRVASAYEGTPINTVETAIEPRRRPIYYSQEDSQDLAQLNAAIPGEVTQLGRGPEPRRRRIGDAQPTKDSYWLQGKANEELDFDGTTIIRNALPDQIARLQEGGKQIKRYYQPRTGDTFVWTDDNTNKGRVAKLLSEWEKAEAAQQEKQDITEQEANVSAYPVEPDDTPMPRKPNKIRIGGKDGPLATQMKERQEKQDAIYQKRLLADRIARRKEADSYFDPKAIAAAKNQPTDSRESFVYMTPEAFLQIASERKPVQQRTKKKRVGKLLSNGEKFSSIPSFVFEHDGVGGAKTVEAEGRERVKALAEKGVKLIPVKAVSTGGGGGEGIKWGKQKFFGPDRIKGDWPASLVSMNGDQMPFPFADPLSEQANKPLMPRFTPESAADYDSMEPDTPRIEQPNIPTEPAEARQQEIDKLEARDLESEVKKGNRTTQTIKWLPKAKGEDNIQEFSFVTNPDGTVEGTGLLRYSDMTRDPGRLQYKKVGVGKKGVTNKLMGVRKWNPEAAEAFSVWVDPKTGITHPLNSHHRHELAERLDWGGYIPVIYVPAKTAEEARARGAVTNIIQDRGDSIDAAMFFRESGITPKQMEDWGATLSNSLASEGFELSKLSDWLFRELTVGRMKKSQALEIVNHLPKHEDQDAAYEYIESRGGALSPEWRDGELEAYVRMKGAVPNKSRQLDLFGEAVEEAGDDYLREVASIQKEASKVVRARLSTFRTASNDAKVEMLEEFGENQLSPELNKQMISYFQTMYDLAEEQRKWKGENNPIREAAKRGGMRYVDAPKDQRQAIKDQAVKEVLQALEEALPRPTGDGSTRLGEASKPSPEIDIAAMKQAGRQTDMFQPPGIVSDNYAKMDALSRFAKDMARGSARLLPDSVSDGINDFRRWFYHGIIPQGHENSLVYEKREQRDRDLAHHAKKAEQNSKLLERAVVEEFGIKRQIKTLGMLVIPEPIVEQLNIALDNKAERDKLPPKTRFAMEEMRDHIDELSRILLKIDWLESNYAYYFPNAPNRPTNKDGSPRKVRRIDRPRLAEINPRLAAVITQRDGVYFTRSYDKFDNPDRNAERALADADLMQDLAEFYRDNYNRRASMQEVETYAKWLLHKDTGNMASEVNSTGLSKKFTDPLKGRKDLPEVIRRLYGEKKSPWENYNESIARVGGFIAHQKFMTELSQMKNLFSPIDDFTNPEHTVTPDVGRPFLRLLRDLKTDPDTARALNELYTMQIPSGVMKVALGTSAYVKESKTVMSVQATSRNLLGNVPFLVANGTWRPMGAIGMAYGSNDANSLNIAREFGKAAKEIWQDNRGTSSAQARQRALIRTELGISDDITVSELREVAKIMSGDITAATGGAGDPYRSNPTVRGWHKFRGNNRRLYQAMDEVWKIISFKEWQDFLQDAAPELNSEERQLEAAKLVRQTMPDYSQLGRLTKYTARVLPIAPFLPFSAEVVRTMGNRAGLIQKWWNHENKHKRKRARQMALGQAFVLSFPTALSAFSMMALGWGDDEERAFRERLPFFQKNAAMIVLGYNDETGEGIAFDFDYMNPFGIFNRAMTAIRVNEDKFDGSLGSVYELLNPILSEDLAASSALNLLRDVDDQGRPLADKGDTQFRQRVDKIASVLKDFMPGTLLTAGRILGESGIPSPFRETVAFEMWGDHPNRTLGYESLAIIGPRVMRFDRDTSDKYRMSELKRDIERTQSSIRKLFLSESSEFSPEMARMEWERFQGELLKRKQFMHEYMQGSKALGLSGRSVYENAAISTGGKSQVLKEAYLGKYKPYLLNKATLRKIRSKPGGAERVQTYLELAKEAVQQNIEAREGSELTE